MIEDAVVGDGYNQLQGGQEGHTGACFDFNANLINLNKRTFNGYYVFEKKDLKREFDENFKGSLSYDQFGAGLEQAYNSQFSGTSVSAVLVIATYYETIRRSTNIGYLDLQNESCNANPALPNFYEFLGTCGNQFISGQTLGGWLFLMADVSSLTTEQRTEISAGLSVGVPGLDFDIDLAMTTLQNSELEQMGLTAYAVGLPSPDQELLDENGKLKPSIWPLYMTQIEQSYTEAQQNGVIDDPSYGTVLDQSLDYYPASFIQTCTGATVNQAGIDCFNQFTAELENVTGDDGEIQREKDTLQWVLDNPTRVHWYGDEQEGISGVQGVIDQIDACEQQFATASDTCLDSLGSDIDGTLCSVCVVPPDCSMDALLGVIGNASGFAIPVVDYDAPEGFYVGHNDSVSISPTDENICVIGGWGGKFEGGGERASLTVDGYGNWFLQASSARTKSSEKMHAQAWCIPTNYIWSENNAFADPVVFSHSVNDSQSTVEGPLDSIVPIAVNGMQGKAMGGGEYVQAIRDGDPNVPGKLRVGSQQGFMQGWASQFGVFDPPNGTPKFWGPPEVISINTNGVSSKQLAPYREAICYLSQVSGKFRGGGEQIILEPKADHWVLTVKAGCQLWNFPIANKCLVYKHVQASATCYQFNQLDP